MANIKVRRKTGSSTYEVIYPTADWSNIDSKPTTFTPTAHTHTKSDITDFGHTHGNIVNDGSISSTTVTPADGDRILIADASASPFGLIQRGIIIGTGTTTYLRNDGQWGTPPTTSYTLPVATSTTLGGIEVGFTSTETNRAVLLSANDGYITLPRQIPAVTLNNVATNTPNFYAPTTVGTSGQRLRSNGTSAVASWTSLTSTGTSSAINSSTDFTVSVAGISFVVVALYRDATTKVAEYIVHIVNTNEFSTTTRNFRYLWNDGTSTFANLLQVQNVSGNLRLRHGSGGTMIFRLTLVG